MGRLDAHDRARVRGAIDREIATLRAELADDPAPSLVGTAGIPRGAQSRALVDAIATRAAA
jgi:hypothetical protein